MHVSCDCKARSYTLIFDFRHATCQLKNYKGLPAPRRRPLQLGTGTAVGPRRRRRRPRPPRPPAPDRPSPDRRRTDPEATVAEKAP